MEFKKLIKGNYIQYGNQKIKIILDNFNEIWFCAKDTAKSLGYLNMKKAIKNKKVVI